jgi:hypothetical protein
VLFVQMAATNLCVKDFTAILIFKFVQAAFGAAVAQRLPLGPGKLVESFGIPPIG